MKHPFLLLALLTVATCPPALAAAQTSPPAGFTLTTGTPRANEQLSVRFDRADLSFRILPAEKRIEGVAVLDFTAKAPFEWMPLELDETFSIESIAIDGEDIHPDDGWNNDNGRLWIEMAGVQTGQTFQLRIAYSGSPHEAKNAPWDGGFVWGKTPDGKPWIATAVQGEGCDLFWPCIDHPQGEPAQVDLHITVPAGLSAPSNGRFLGKTDNTDGTTTWNWSARQPNTYAIALNVGPYVEMAAD